MSVDPLAASAFIISLFTLLFSIWRWFKTPRSEQLKIARERMLSVFECRKILDTFFHKYRSSPPADDQDKALDALEWFRNLGDLMFEAEEFRAFVIIQGIGKQKDILHHKLRLHHILI